MKIKRVLTKNAVEFEDIIAIDDKKAIEITDANSDGWIVWKHEIMKELLKKSFGCTGVMKKIGGKMLMSRNMDYLINNKTECVFKMCVPGRYKSINVTNYSNRLSEDFDAIVKDGGIPDEKNGFLAYFTLDGVNEKGLVIEANMRPTEYESNSVIPTLLTDSTNEGKTRVPVSAIPRLILDNCANMDEMLKFVGATDGATGKKYGEGEYDFYTFLSEESNWILSFSIMDENGRYGVLEPINDKLVWTENAKGQANFFVDKETESRELYGSGYGRWDYIMKAYDSINTEKDFFDLTKKISYSMAERNTADWDISTESTHIDVFGTVEVLAKFAEKNGIVLPDTKNLRQTMKDENGNIVVLTMDNYKKYSSYLRAAMWTKDFVEKDETGEVKAKIEWISKVYKILTEKQMKELNFFWNTAHHELYNSNDRTLKIEFWETGEVFDFAL